MIQAVVTSLDCGTSNVRINTETTRGVSIEQPLGELVLNNELYTDKIDIFVINLKHFCI